MGPLRSPPSGAHGDVVAGLALAREAARLYLISCENPINEKGIKRLEDVLRVTIASEG
jgi:hypothetical protein